MESSIQHLFLAHSITFGLSQMDGLILNAENISVEKGPFKLQCKNINFIFFIILKIFELA